MPRFLNAVLAWVRSEVLQEEEGQEKWQQVVTWLETPPLAPSAARVGSRRRSPVTEAARAAVGDEAAAFAALQGMTG